MPKTNEIDRHIGRRLKRAREAKGLTQQQLGAVIPVTFQQVQKYENGSNRVSASHLFLFSRALGEDPGAFFKEIDFGN